MPDVARESATVAAFKSKSTPVGVENQCRRLGLGHRQCVRAAHQAIKTSLLSTADATPRQGPDGLIRIWLDRKFVDRLAQMRGPGESYSEVILRLAEESS
jgi:hypothetical protein